jgi:hypothetical protein
VPRGQRDGSLRQYSRFSRPVTGFMELSNPLHGFESAKYIQYISQCCYWYTEITVYSQDTYSSLEELLKLPVSYLCCDG